MIELPQHEDLANHSSNNTKSENLEGDITKFLRKSSCCDGVRARNRSVAGLKRKRKKVLRLVGICWGFSC